jgi:hypothetical protein
MARIQSSTLKELLRRVLRTKPEEIGCETCYEHLDRFVELELEGKEAAQALPLVQRHIEVCSGCNEEYRALLSALQSLDKSP